MKSYPAGYEGDDMSEYHCKESCNKCTGENKIKIIDTDEGFISECETICKKCGHKDYWANGFFQSSSEMESRCKTYNVG